MSNNLPIKVALYGLSADPVHNGHKSVIRKLILSKKYNKIYIIPVYSHIYSSKKLSPYLQRLAMLDAVVLALQIENPDLFLTCSIEVITIERDMHELINGGKPKEELKSIGTVDIITELINTNPNTNFSFVLGTDTFSDLMAGKWKRGSDILQMVNLVIVQRYGIISNIDEIISNSKIDSSSLIYTIIVLENIQVQISSTLIREFLKIESNNPYQLVEMGFMSKEVIDIIVGLN